MNLSKYSHRRFFKEQGWLKICILAGLVFIKFDIQAQPLSGWDILNLSSVIREPSNWSDQEEEKILKTPELAKHENKILQLRGYVLPVEWSSSQVIILSRYPFQSCFFCGAAGPQTVIEVYLSHPKKFDADELITVEGRLRFNDSDPLKLFFILESAEVL